MRTDLSPLRSSFEILLISPSNFSNRLFSFCLSSSFHFVRLFFLILISNFSHECYVTKLLRLFSLYLKRMFHADVQLFFFRFFRYFVNVPIILLMGRFRISLQSLVYPFNFSNLILLVFTGRFLSKTIHLHQKCQKMVI